MVTIVTLVIDVKKYGIHYTHHLKPVKIVIHHIGIKKELDVHLRNK